jgi:hypothetical protein
MVIARLAVTPAPGGSESLLTRVLEPRPTLDESAWPLGWARRCWLPATPRMPEAARRFVWAVCADWGRLGLADAAVACVSELGTNALMHVDWDEIPGPRCVAVEARTCGHGLVIEVVDPDPQVPVIPGGTLPELPADAVDELLPVHGWGLHHVVALARETGGAAGVRLIHTDDQTVGKAVWVSFGTEQAPRDG